MTKSAVLDYDIWMDAVIIGHKRVATPAGERDLFVALELIDDEYLPVGAQAIIYSDDVAAGEVLDYPGFISTVLGLFEEHADEDRYPNAFVIDSALELRPFVDAIAALDKGLSPLITDGTVDFMLGRAIELSERALRGEGELANEVGEED